MHCYDITCVNKVIIRFEYDAYDKRAYCLDHLIELLENVRDNDEFHAIKNAKKIIPIYNF